MKKIYISGKITGDKNYKEKFEFVQNTLKSCGYSIMNPAVLPEGFTHEEYMKICFSMIDICDCIYMLSDWNESEGAKRELSYAKEKGKYIVLDEYDNKFYPFGKCSYCGKEFNSELINEYDIKHCPWCGCKIGDL